MFRFDIKPRPAPRETQGQRDSGGYAAWKEEIQWMAKAAGFELGNCFRVIFLIPVLKKWSSEERAARHLTPHQAKSGPDWDNQVKAVMDALLPHRLGGDAKSWDGRVTKLWVNGAAAILIRNLDEAKILIEVRAELAGMDYDNKI